KGGNRFNGLVRAGTGIPASEIGRVGTSAAILALVPAGAPRGFYKPANRIAPRFGFAYDPWGNGKTSIRGGFGMYYDKVEGNLIFSQVNLPPFISTPQFENGNLSNISGGTPSALAPLAGISAIDPNLKIAYSMNYSIGVQRELPRGFFVEASYVGNQGRHLIRQPDLNAIPFDALVANVPPGPNANLNTLRRYKGYTSIAYRLSDATSTYNGLQLYAVKRKGDLELTAAYTWSRNLTDTSGNGDGLDVGEDPFNRHYNYGPASFDRRHIFVTTYDYHIPFLRGKKGVEGALLSGWEVSGITRFQSGAYFTPTGSTAIGTRRADYIGGPVLLSKPGPDGWVNPAVFAPAPLGRRGNAPVGIVQGPNLQTWDFSMRKQFRLTERFNLRFQADMFNAFNRANFRSPDVGFGTCLVTSTSACAPSNGAFGKISSTGPARNIQFGLKLNF
ncbi:MAG: TonB-dependent receptor, partial [Acidobacteria bacterium]